VSLTVGSAHVRWCHGATGRSHLDFPYPDEITGIDHNDELEVVVVVRTAKETNFEDKLRKETLTSGCAQGTAVGDLLERFERVTLDLITNGRTAHLQESKGPSGAQRPLSRYQIVDMAATVPGAAAFT
jgi:hypothetical protein